MVDTTQGHMTLPVEVGQEEVVLDLYKRWQADALRDSDGTTMPDSLAEQDCDIYSVLCIVRADQEYAKVHPEYLHRKYLSSFPQTAMSTALVIKPLDGYCSEKYELDNNSDPKQHWEVRNRTTNAVLPVSQWDYDAANDTIIVSDTTPYHEYTASVMVRQVWDSVSMYNALTNGWTGDKIRSLDPYHPECRTHLKRYFAKWLDDHPNTTVVRFTTFAFLFVIDANEKIKISTATGRAMARRSAQKHWMILKKNTATALHLKTSWMRATTMAPIKCQANTTLTGWHSFRSLWRNLRANW